MNRIKIPEGADTILIAFNGEMSKMNDEQREAMTSLNAEAKAVALLREKEKPMNEIPIDTPFKEAHGEEIAVPKASYADIPVPSDVRAATSEEERAVKSQYDPMTPLLPLPDPLLQHLADKDYGVTNSLRYTQETMADEFFRVFENEIMALRNAGQKEYAHEGGSPFANFERGADDAGIDRKQILWIYAMKHKDGIAAALKGHTSQREDVRGRINDLIVYLFLLRGMFNEEFGDTGNFGLGELEK